MTREEVKACFLAYDLRNAYEDVTPRISYE
ncbi:hypothetical protein HNR50_003752 [Spirochaeta isovalerica]|uniref:Uncharacterized protein n=1 Tax=Spirochaeta isovalerica TaxID=150 RepID=A0A841R9N8_9SPIO|nr:hypothetical protein [Spirochaeta isovalerica]